MIQYIYFVKCPNCEDEPFDFFDEAKGYAMGCLSQKPIITQIEVNRNDFGECVDSCDLGTVWSWEEMMKDTESEDMVFSKDETFGISEDLDDFDDFDIGPQSDEFAPVDFDDFAYAEDEAAEKLTEAKVNSFHVAIFEALDYLTEFSDIFPVPENIMADSWAEMKDDINYGISSDFEIAEIIMEYLDKDLAISRKHPEMFEDDPQSELTLEIYNRLKRAYDRAVADYEAAHPEDFEESCCKEAITESAEGALAPENLSEFSNHLKQIAGDRRTRRVSVDEIIEPTDDFGEDEISSSIYWDDNKNAFEFELNVYHSSMDNNFEVGPDGYLTDDYYETYTTIEELYNDYPIYVKYLYDAYKSSERKAIPDGMTIDQLKEAMEENEDTVECAGCEELFPKEDCFHKDGIGWLCGDCEDRIVKCTWCQDLYDKSECRYEVDLGWLCDRCEAAIKSRGETLTFKEGNYWDFLDEEVEEPETADKPVKEKLDAEELAQVKSEIDRTISPITRELGHMNRAIDSLKRNR